MENEIEVPYIKKCTFCNKDFVYSHGTQEQIDEWTVNDEIEGNNKQFCDFECERQHRFKIKTEKVNKKILKNIPLIEKDYRYYIFQRDNFRCVICGRSAGNGLTLQEDHWIPRNPTTYEGKLSDYYHIIYNINNMVTLCNECNNSKNNTMPNITAQELLKMKEKPPFTKFPLTKLVLKNGNVYKEEIMEE